MVRSLSLPSRGRAACYYCGQCERGCITRSKSRRANATLPAATKTGPDDVTALQRGAHKGALLLRMGKALAPGYRRP